MSDSPAGSAAFLSGEEIVNDQRTLSYLENGFGPLSIKINGGCACPRIQELIECDSEPYSSPAADPAPWYDSSVPESSDFAGFLTTEFEGLGSTYTREVFDKITGGAVLGRIRPKARLLTWKGFLFGRSDCAVRYGLSWLASNLKGTNCSCNGEELDLMVCCPDLIDTPPVSGCTSLPAISRPNLCPPFTQPDAFRQLKNVGLVDGPKVLSTRRIGCKSSCGNDTCAGDTIIMEIEFSLLAGTPYMFGCPVCLCSDQSFPNNDDEDCLVTANSSNPKFIKVFPPGTAADCDFNCDPPDDYTRPTNDLNCPPVSLPVVPEFQDGCFCDPLDPVQFCCEVPQDSFGQFFEGAPVIEIYSGSDIMKSTTVRFFANPQGLECCDVAENPCLNCDSVQVWYIPKESTLTIDGTTRTVTIQKGEGLPVLADHLTVTPFAWPILQCVDYCICVETDGAIVAPDATVSILVVPREMG